jgi:hypothetical protein
MYDFEQMLRCFRLGTYQRYKNFPDRINLVTIMQKNRDQRSEIGGQRSEIRRKKARVRIKRRWEQGRGISSVIP